MPRLGTFNIRLFPDRGTEPQVVAQRIAELDADLFMVQEIRDGEAFDAVLAQASALTGRDYAVGLGPMCRTSELQLGGVHDRRRFREVERRVQAQLDPEARCSCRDGHPPALLSVLESVADGARLAAMSVHLQYGGRRWMHRARRDQWDHLVASILRVREELGLLTRPVDEELAVFHEEKEAFLRLLRERGLLADGASEQETVEALHTLLTRAPSRLLGVTLADLVGDRRTQNQPGTDQEYPNWRIPLSGPDGSPLFLDDLADSDRARRLAALVGGSGAH